MTVKKKRKTTERKSSVQGDSYGTAWAVVRDHRVIVWESCCDGDYGFELHRTRKEANGACFKNDGEYVVRVRIVPA